MVRILLVDDHASVAEAFEALLSQEPDFEVIGLCVTAREAIEQAKEHKPDLILMDVSIPDDRKDESVDEPEGITATRAITTADPSIRVIALTSYLRPRWEIAAREAGVWRYLPKQMPREQLVKAIREVLEADAAPPKPSGDPAGSRRRTSREERRRLGAMIDLEYEDDRIGRELGIDPSDVAEYRAQLRKQTELTEQQIAVLREIYYHDSTDHQIAAALGISPATVAWHVAEAKKRLDVDGRGGAARRANALGYFGRP